MARVGQNSDGDRTSHCRHSRSVLSFALPSAMVCYCMLEGASAQALQGQVLGAL